MWYLSRPAPFIFSAPTTSCPRWTTILPLPEEVSTPAAFALYMIPPMTVRMPLPRHLWRAALLRSANTAKPW